MATPSKYDRLAEYLKNLRRDEVVLTFDEIEHILGFKLPQSARKRVWWVNDVRRSRAVHGWLKVGWKVEFAHITKGEVGFRRVGEEYFKKLKAEALEREILKPKNYYSEKNFIGELGKGYRNIEEFRVVVKEFFPKLDFLKSYVSVRPLPKFKDVEPDIIFLENPEGRKIVCKPIFFGKPAGPHTSKIKLLEISHSLYVLKTASEKIDATETFLICGGETIKPLYQWTKKYYEALLKPEEKKVKLIFIEKDGKVYDITESLPSLMTLIER